MFYIIVCERLGFFLNPGGIRIEFFMLARVVILSLIEMTPNMLYFF